MNAPKLKSKKVFNIKFFLLHTISLTRLKQFDQVIMLEVNIVVRGCTLEKVMQTILIVKIVYSKDYFHI